MRKYLLCAAIVFGLPLLSEAQDSPEAAIERYYSIESTFASYLQTYLKSRLHGPGTKAEEKLKERLISIYESSLTGALLKSHADSLRMKTFHFEDRAIFFPAVPELLISRKNIFQNEKESLVKEYSEKKDVYSSLDNFSLGDGNQLRNIINDFRVVNISYDAAYAEIDGYIKSQAEKGLSSIYELHLCSEPISTFHFVKTSQGWRIDSLKFEERSPTLTIKLE